MASTNNVNNNNHQAPGTAPIGPAVPPNPGPAPGHAGPAQPNNNNSLVPVSHAQQAHSAGFRYFRSLPEELQIKIFTKLIEIPAPNFHKMIGKATQRVDDQGNRFFGVSFHPVTRSIDRSQYRELETFRGVNEESETAARLESNRRGQNNFLPFRRQGPKFSSANDLVIIQLPAKRHEASRFGYWNLFNQHLNTNGVLDCAALEESTRGMQHVALEFQPRDPSPRSVMSNWRCTARCPPPPQPVVVMGPGQPWPPQPLVPQPGLLPLQHQPVAMCPVEVNSFLLRFRDLRSFWVIVDPAAVARRSNFTIFVKNYLSLPEDCPLRRNLQVFHGRGLRYIEYEEFLVTEENGRVLGLLGPDVRRFKADLTVAAQLQRAQAVAQAVAAGKDAAGIAAATAAASWPRAIKIGVLIPVKEDRIEDWGAETAVRVASLLHRWEERNEGQGNAAGAAQ
ncbi:hypothetical protein VTJ49DRAFT_6379 [Mycothermus thermophilus]|uniref:Uncharacterized protein n=1 Tax=Humicola insolens TaxID=85995 RepID=A0ABR3VPZ1_HUMIN